MAALKVEMTVVWKAGWMVGMLVESWVENLVEDWAEKMAVLTVEWLVGEWVVLKVAL